MKFKILTLAILILSCKEHTETLPILSYDFVDGKKQTYKIEGYEFINQDNNTITRDTTVGYVHTINFFFTSCPSICPPMRIQQSALANYFSKEKRFKQYSISIDYKNDTIEQLAYYSKIHDINSTQWNLLRATSEDQLKNIANQLKTNFRPNESGTDFYHSSYAALIDKKGYIRGFYNLLLDEEIELLKGDVKLLLE